MGSTNGYNLGVSLPNAALFSLAASTGDTVLRTKTNTNLLLQSGSGTYGILINGSNNILCNSTSINGVLNVSSTTRLNGATTCISSLNVSGSTTLNNATTLLSSLYVVGNIIGSGTALTNLNYNAITNKPDLTVYAKVPSTQERQYPPKLYNTSTNEITSSNDIFNIGPVPYYKQTITLNTTGITYGSGTYELYSSSIFSNPSDQTAFRKRDAFNYSTTDIGGLWITNNYTLGSGSFTPFEDLTKEQVQGWVIDAINANDTGSVDRMYAGLATQIENQITPPTVNLTAPWLVPSPSPSPEVPSPSVTPTPSTTPTV
jgi:hypothetical protein